MHSYIFSGNDEKKLEDAISSYQKTQGATILEFQMEKIEQVRELATITKLKTKDKTAILIRNIEKATPEASNAFLKNLEEPHPNISYILTASSIHKVMPTIVSRCQIVNIGSSNKLDSQKTISIDRFLKLKTSDKLSYINSIKKKQEAEELIQDIILVMHQKLIEEKYEFGKLINILKNAQRTYRHLNANGNVNLQLTNFVLSLAQNEAKLYN